MLKARVGRGGGANDLSTDPLSQKGKSQGPDRNT